MIEGKEVIRSAMGKEVERASQAVDLARDHVVAMVSGGDPGVYGMAGIVLEVLEESGAESKCRGHPRGDCSECCSIEGRLAAFR